MKIKSIKSVSYNDYTYTLTVQDNHNYYIGSVDSNVLSKNSQAEVRVLAKMSNDQGLLTAFRNGADLHTFNASMMWNKPMEEVTPTERSMAKGVTFSLLYGTSISEFANKYTKGNLQEARKVISNFFKSYPEVEKFIKEMHIKGVFTDTVPTLFGDPIYVDMPSWVKVLSEDDKLKLAYNPYSKEVVIPGRKLSEEDERKERAKLSKSLRNSQNYAIQGSSSTLAGLALYELQKCIEEDNLSVKLECFTHDSCDADLRLKDLIKTLLILPKASTEFLEKTYNIPMKIDYAIGVSNNKMVELTDTKITGNSIKSHFHSTEESIKLLKTQIEKNGGILTYEVKKTKDAMISIRDLFLTTNAYAKSLGKAYSVVSGELEIII